MGWLTSTAGAGGHPPFWKGQDCEEWHAALVKKKKEREASVSSFFELLKEEGAKAKVFM